MRLRSPVSGRLLLCVGLAALTAFCVLLLPFHFPPAGPPVRSPAWAAGFNNRVAEVATALLSILAAGIALRSVSSSQPRLAEPLSRRWLYASLTLIAAWTLLLGAALIRARTWYGEATYFLTQTEKVLALHLTLYRDVQFAYGPLLLWWPALWMKLLGTTGPGQLYAYVLAMVTMQAAGIGLCFYIANALPLSRPLKLFALGFLTLGAISPTLGLNYTIFRFVVPVAVAVGLSRQTRLLLAALTAALGVLSGFFVSAEIGVACAAGAVILALYRALTGKPLWLSVALASIAGAVASRLLLGPDYFFTLSSAGAGAYDLIVTPEPRTLILLIAVVALAPIAVARALRLAASDPSQASPAALTLGIFATTLALLPVALGRADSVHQFFFSLGAVLLSLLAVDPVRPGWRNLWLICLIGSLLMSQAANLHLYGHSLARLAQEAVHPPATGSVQGAPDALDLAALERQLHGHPVTIVDTVPWWVNEALLRDRLVQPAFYTQASGVWFRAAEQRKIAEMRLGQFALAPVEGMTASDDFDQGSILRWRRLGLPYRELRPPFLPGQLLDAELLANWQPVATFGDTRLYHRLR